MLTDRLLHRSLPSLTGQHLRERLKLETTITALTALYAGASFVTARRATHQPKGVGARGYFEPARDPELADDGYFREGVRLPVRLHHTAIDLGDAAALDMRSLAVSFGGAGTGVERFDLMMNTGARDVFENGHTILALTRGRMGGKEGMKTFLDENPGALRALREGMRREASSFAQLYYYNQVILGHRDAAGTYSLCRLRVIPEDRGPESGLPTAQDLDDVQLQERLPGSRVPKRHLVTEYEERLRQGPIRFHLQIQLHTPMPSDPPGILNTQDVWDEDTHPWRDLGTLVADQLAPEDEAEGWMFGAHYLPSFLEVLPARSLADYNSVMYMRTRLYPVAHNMRRLALRTRRPKPHSMDPDFDDGTQTGAPEHQDTLSVSELAQWYGALDADKQDEVSALFRAQVQAAKPGRSANKTHVAVGRLVHEVPGVDEDGPPLHHLKVQLWDRDVGPTDDFLGESMTDADGRFEIWYDPADAGAFDLPDLELRVFAPQHRVRHDGTIVDHWEWIDSHPGDDDVTVDHYDFGNVRLPYWEYDPAMPIPRALIPDQGEAPERYSRGRAFHMAKKVARIEAIKRKHLLTLRMNPERLTFEKIQADYPPSLTMQIERERPGYTRSDEYFGLRVMNGMSACVPDGDPENPGWYRIYIPWNAYEHDGVHCMPTTDMRFELRDGQLYPVQIILHMREPFEKAANAPTTVHTFTPADGERWEQAKRIARVSLTMDTEVSKHLTECHLNMEQYAVAAARNLRLSPLRALLWPHLREVSLINSSAMDFLLGPEGYITRASALTPTSVVERAAQHLGTLDWKDWEPAPPMSDKHVYGKAALLYWDLAGQWVDEYFETHHDAIVDNWLEVKRFSDDLMEHSAPMFLCRYLSNMLFRGEEVDWYVWAERMNVKVDREVVGGVPKALSRITTSDESPTAEDLENIKQVCRYILHHATFKHTWANNRQWDDGGEVLYNCLGLRWTPEGIFFPESDERIAPSKAYATELLWVSAMLSWGGYGTVLHNEDEDIAPGFIQRIRAHAEEFKSYNVDVTEILARINI